MEAAKDLVGTAIAACENAVLPAIQIVVEGAAPAQLGKATVAGLVAIYVLSCSLHALIVAFVILAACGLWAMALIVAFVILAACGLWAMPVATFFVSLALGLSYALYAVNVFRAWESAFSGHRMNRGKDASPSNKELPDIKSLEQNKSHILENSRFHSNFDDCELIHDLQEMKVVKKENEAFRARAKRLGTTCAAKAARLIQRRMSSNLSLSSEKAVELNMDHVYVKFTDFLWGLTFIGPFSYILWKRGTTVLRFRKFLEKIGLINPEEKCDYEALAATLCLEQTQAIHYYARTKKGSELGNIAGFFFADFPYVGPNCEFKIANLFAVDIDLDTKRFVKAKLDDEILDAKEAVILLWFNTIAAQHVKLHAMANWGTNLSDSLEGVNSFLRQNSVVTTMYNYFGYSSFSTFFEEWVRHGLLSEGWMDPSAPWVTAVNHGIKENIYQHAQIDGLAKHSRFVKFVIKTRAIFLAEFQKHKHLFPGVDGEAMFVGTVLHSLDHTLMDWNLKDPLYLDTEDSRFGKMAEMGQVVKAGFVSDVDGLYFQKRFKGSGHPFYDAVYKRAAKVDKLLADHMDTCIIK